MRHFVEIDAPGPAGSVATIKLDGVPLQNVRWICADLRHGKPTSVVLELVGARVAIVAKDAQISMFDHAKPGKA